jgi:hypothetical protein
MKGSASLRRFCWLQVNFSYGWGSAGGQEQQESSMGRRLGCAARVTGQGGRSTALLTVLRPVSAQAAVHLPTLSSCIQP